MTESPPDSTPLVSVVMSAYNDADCVGEAVASIRGQTFADWELIVVDDGSTDRTGEVLADLARKEPRLRILTQANAGLTSALIAGCEIAHGRHIARQDADDRSHPDRLARQVALLESDPALGFVSCFADYVAPGGEYLYTVTRPECVAEATDGLLNRRLGPPAHGTVMFRRDLYRSVGGYRAAFHFAQDCDLWLRLGERAQLAYVPDRLYSAARSPESTSGAMRPIQARFGVLANACRAARAAGESEEPTLREATALAAEVREMLAADAGPAAARLRATARSRDQSRYLIGSQLASNRDRRAAHYLLPVLRRRPWMLKGWLRLLQSQLGGRVPQAAVGGREQ